MRFITELFIEQFGSSYMTPATIGNRWRSEIAYTNEAEQFLIDKTKLFLRTLDTKNPDYRNLAFLRSLTKSMADYLSKYTMRAFLTANAKDSDIKQARKDAENFLFDVLFTNNRYIKNLQAKQEDKHFDKFHPAEGAKRRQRIKVKKVQEARQVANQVKVIFIEVNQYKKGK